jgi:protein STE50
VQRDPAGSGQVEPDTTKQGWVPAGCLLETNVPVATAIAEATSKGGSSSPTVQQGSTPILPLSILSTSFPGIALMDYTKKGEEELTLAKDDTLRVFKRYNHWSYVCFFINVCDYIAHESLQAVKEENGDRGWVPSWYIGKVPAPAGAPATPSTSGTPHHFNSTTLSLDGDTSASSNGQQAQVSPMSSAFPPLQAQSRPGLLI